MSAILFKYICSSCGREFQASGAPEMSYGEFVLRSESNEEAYLEAVTNKIFNEVSQLVEAHPLLKGASASISGDLVQKVFSVACDPDSKGCAFHIGMMPKCPSCSSRDMAAWGEVYPPELSSIPMVTHVSWSNLTEFEKSDLVNNAVRKFL